MAHSRHRCSPSRRVILRGDGVPGAASSRRASSRRKTRASLRRPPRRAEGIVVRRRCTATSVMAMNVIAKDPNVGGLHVVARRRRQRLDDQPGRVFISAEADRNERTLIGRRRGSRTDAASWRRCRASRAYVQNPPAINIGGRSAKSLYQYTLQGADIDRALSSRAAGDAGQAAATCRACATSPATCRSRIPQVNVDIDRDRASVARRDDERRCRTRSTTRTARGRSPPSTRRQQPVLGASWSCCRSTRRTSSAMSLIYVR